MKKTTDFAFPVPSIMDQVHDNLDKYNFTGIKKQTNIVKNFAQKWLLKISKTPTIEWKLVNDDDIPVITRDDAHETDLEIEEKYIELVKSEVELFDCVILITNLLQIKCLRQYSLYTSEENVNYLNSFILKSYFFYYIAIKGFVGNFEDRPIYFFGDFEAEISRLKLLQKTPSNNFKIPKSIFWNTSNLTNTGFYNSKFDIVSKLIIIQNYKIENIKAIKINYDINCKKFEKMLIPTMGQTGINQMCNSLLDNFSDFTLVTQFVSFSLFNEDETNLKNIDLNNTVDFNNHIIELQVALKFITNKINIIQ